MDRIFHARIAVGQYVFLALATYLAVFFLWEKVVVAAAVFLLLLVFGIERLIHTTYTLTGDGKLRLYYGRFSAVKEISLRDVAGVERAASLRIGRWAMMRGVLVRCRSGKSYALFPVKEEDFVRLLEKRLCQDSARLPGGADGGEA